MTNEVSSFYWPYVSICCSCLSFSVTVGVSFTPAERNLDHKEEYYNSNHDAGTVVVIDRLYHLAKNIIPGSKTGTHY